MKTDRQENAGPRHAAKMLKRAGRSPRLRVEMAEVENPYWSPAHDEGQTNPRKIRAVRNTNESPLTLMEARGTITPMQAKAGERFRMIYERVMRGTPSPGDIKERVQTSGAPDVLTDGRIQAGRDLAHAAKQIGSAEYWLVRCVCGEGMSLREVAVRTKVRRSSATVALRHALDRLAEAWGLASRGSADAALRNVEPHRTAA